MAYHALGDLLIGAASLEAGLEKGVYDGWRRRFAALPQERFPNATALAPHLFPDADDEFAFALMVLIAGIEGVAGGLPERAGDPPV